MRRAWLVVLTVAALVGAWPLAGASGAAAAGCPGPDAFGYTCGIVHRAYVPGTAPAEAGCSGCPGRLALPFSFPIYGQTVTWAAASPHGALYLGTAPLDAPDDPGGRPLPARLTVDASVVAVLFPYWDALSTDRPGGIFTTTVGTAPQRLFVVEWRATARRDGRPVHFAVQLEEATQVIYFVYAAPGDGGAWATIGLQSAAGTTALQRSYRQAVLTAGSAVRFAPSGRVPAAGRGVRDPTGYTVTIQNFTFSPAQLTINVNDTVTWTNADFTTHTSTSTSAPGSWDSGGIPPGQSFTPSPNPFTMPGTYSYVCTLHLGMTGRIIVQESTGPTATLTRTSTPTATVLATSTPTATATATGGLVACNPRPRVRVAVAPGNPGRLEVTITATTNPGSVPNRLRRLRFTSMTNARIDVPGGPQDATGAFVVTLTSPVEEISFTVRRERAGQSTHANLIVEDDCGDWSTFVGGGPNAF